jgi:hypothetical protein
VPTWRCEPNGHAVIVIIEDYCSSTWPACGSSRRRNDNGYEQEGLYPTTQQEPEGARESGVEVRLPVCHQEGDCSFQACAAQGDGRLPVHDKVPGCSREAPFLCRITHSGALDLRRIEITLHNAGPLARQHAEPDGMALDP